MWGSGNLGLKVSECVDQGSWDAFVGSCETGNLAQSWGWGEIVSSLGARVYRRTVVDDGVIRAAVSVASNEIRFTGRRILHVSHGPVVDDPSELVFGLLMGELEKIARAEKAVGVKLEPYVPAENRNWPALLATHGFRPLFPPSQPRSQWMIDLEPCPDAVLAAMKPKWRYNIRLAAKRGVEITHGAAEDVSEFYALYRETAERDGFYIQAEDKYHYMFETFWKLGQFDLLLARYEGKLISAVTLVTVGSNCCYLFGASGNGNRELMAPHGLQWEAMRVAKSRGALLYDMRGVADTTGANQDMAGVLRFKQGFGGRHVTFLEQYGKSYSRPLYHLWKAYWQGRFTVQTMKRRRQGLPHRTWA